MGNALLRFICGGRCCSASDQSLGHHGVTQSTVGVSALAQDLLHFDVTSQVPEGLSQHVVSSKKAQANWYKKLWEAWRVANPPPRTPEEAARLIVLTLKNHHHADVEGLLAFYGFVLPGKLEPEEISPASPAVTAAAKPQGFKFELHTLPVDAKSIADGDTVTVYVSTADPRESSIVPPEVHKAATARAKARAAKNYTKADALHKTIIEAGYRFIPGVNGKETLAKKYRIRLSGIDSPESAMPYGKEAKEEMVNLVLGQPLKVYVYNTDRYGRCVGDIYCNGIFVQEVMLKKGMAWHYTAYDQRPELSAWEKQAKAARVGLWASKNPKEPWEWRKEKRNGA